MSVILFEILIIGLLVIANGVFAMSEMAIVSARKARLEQAARAGDSRARAALELANAPERFLSTVQIGITLVGILAGAFGGATIAEQIGIRLAVVPPLAPYADAIGIGVVVLLITYLSLVFGELVPKRLALNMPERVAATVARPMNLLSAVAAPFVRLLEISTAATLRALRIRPSAEPPVTEEEIKVLIGQGTKAGVFEAAEQDMIESVLRLGDRRVSALMTTRLDIVWLDINTPIKELRRKIAASHYSRFPVCRGAVDNVLGVVKAREFLAYDPPDETADWKTLIKRPLYVPESSSSLRVLELFKKAHMHMAFVMDEHGGISGLVTTNDVLEAIVGDVVQAGKEVEPYAVRREDGSWLLDGLLPIDEFKKLFADGELSGGGRGSYHTLAGFVMTRLGRVPATADIFEWQGLRFEVMDMDGKRVDKVLVTPARENPVTE